MGSRIKVETVRKLREINGKLGAEWQDTRKPQCLVTESQGAGNGIRDSKLKVFGS